MRNKRSVMSSELSDINPIDENLERIPEILYKYRSFDSCGYGLQLASNGEAYFASAKDFNDPFDNYFIPTTEMTNYEGEELIAFLLEKAQQHYPRANKYEIEELVEEGKKQHRRIKAGDPRAFEPILETQYNGFGIFSLVAHSRSLPMWAYYADSHKGMCVGLRSVIIAQHQRDLLRQGKLLMLHKVHYSNNIPEVCVDIGSSGMTDEDLNELEATLHTKSKQWENEEEYRLLYFKHAFKTYIFGTDAVAEILIGLRVSDENIDMLLKQLRISKSKAVVKRAVRSKSEYKLEFEELQR